LSRAPQAVVIGAGVGGLAAALDLAASGVEVTLFERHDAPGGRMREIRFGDACIDSGPTVFTMRWVFEDLFAAAGMRLDERLTLLPADTLARHAWLDGGRLDLYADVERSAAAIGELSGRHDAAAYRDFAAESARIFDTLDHSFMRREKPGPVELVLSLGLGGIPRLWATRPFVSLWRALGQRFRDPRLQQLFGRYATYCGSSPFESPATLMLIAHAERVGVWRVGGGMQRLAEALAEAARERGADLHFGRGVKRLRIEGGRVRGVELDDGSAADADVVVFNGDVQALGRGLLGDGARRALPARERENRSLSAFTWSLVGRNAGWPLDFHNVLFGSDYRAEFARIFSDGTLCDEPTIYLCAPDRARAEQEQPAHGAAERLFLLVNAPPRPFDGGEYAAIQERVFDLLQRFGLPIEIDDGRCRMTGPNEFAVRFPGSDGAIYGWPTHGWSGTFKRAGAGTRISGLVCAGGSVHPGPGVPMATLSGRLAAARARRLLGL
jgi:1-hydroxycarotenoid 3,4-desaturase